MRKPLHPVFGLFFLFFVSLFSSQGIAQDKCLYISEVMYNPEGRDSQHEYLEICNVCNVSFELDSLFLKGVDFEFPSYQLQPFSAVVVLRNEQEKLNVSHELCCFSGSLVNSGENISLWERTNSTGEVLLDSFFYPVVDQEGYAAVRSLNGSVVFVHGGNPGECYTYDNYSNIDKDSNTSISINENEPFNCSCESYNSTYNLTNCTICNSTGMSGGNSSDLNSEINEENFTNNLTDGDYTINASENTTADLLDSNSTLSTNSSGSNSVANSSFNDSGNETSMTNQTTSNSIETQDEKCKKDFVYIKAPKLIGDKSVHYEIRLFKWNCSPYLLKDFKYLYWVEDFCGHVIRHKRVSSLFGYKSFTPKTQCCAFSINAKLIEPFESPPVHKFLIKPQACLEGNEAIEMLNKLNTSRDKNAAEKSKVEKREEQHPQSNSQFTYLVPLYKHRGIIKSFYTRKKYFRLPIKFFANLDLSRQKGKVMLFAAELAQEAEDGKNVISLNLSHNKGELILVVANASHLLDAYVLNYSFILNSSKINNTEINNSGEEAYRIGKRVKENSSSEKNLLSAKNERISFMLGRKIPSNPFSFSIEEPSLKDFLELEKKKENKINLSPIKNLSEVPGIQGGVVFLSEKSRMQKFVYKLLLPFSIFIGGLIFYYSIKHFN